MIPVVAIGDSLESGGNTIPQPEKPDPPDQPEPDVLDPPPMADPPIPEPEQLSPTEPVDLMPIDPEPKATSGTSGPTSGLTDLGPLTDLPEGPGYGRGKGEKPGVTGDPKGVPGGLDDPAAVFDSGARPDIISPVLIHRVEPEYPPLLRKIHVEGTVILRAVIGADGTVGSVEVLRSSHEMLSRSAVDAVSRWIYTPGRLGDRPVRVRVTVTVRFALR